jgi:hypothetical protein
MAFTVRPIVVTDVATADAALIVPQLAVRGAFESQTKPALFVLPILRYRTAGTLSLRASMVLIRHIVIEAQLTSLTQSWPIIASVECLGQVDTGTLTEPCLASLLTQARLLAFGVFGGNLREPKHLTDATTARKGIALAVCGEPARPWLTFLDRIGEALLPVIGARVPV